VIVGTCVAGWLAPAAGAFTFTPAPGSPYAVDAPAFEAAAGDLNGDGSQDLLVNSAAPLNIGAQGQVFLADGNGGFSEADVGVRDVTEIVFADFNGDGMLDLAGATEQTGTTPGSASHTPPGITVELGHGDGTFAAAPGSPMSLGCAPSSIVAGDLNNDGKADLAALCPNDTVSVLLGAGDGTFTLAPGSPFSLGPGTPGAIAAGHFTADGRLDLAVTNETQGTVSILLGNGDGTFTQAPGSPIAVGGQPSSLAVADFNRDGTEDLAVEGAPADDMTVLLGRGHGTFAQAPGSPIALGGQSFGGPVAEDFNSDGIPDLAVGLSSGFDLLLGGGSGRFTAAHDSPFAQGELLLAGGTFDGRSAVIVGDAMSASVLLAPLPSAGPTAALSVAAKRVTAGQRVALDASGSSDPLDRALTDYRWDLGNGRFSHDTGATPALRASFPTAGTIHLRVRVTNAAGETATANATLVVHPAPRTAVIAGAVRVCLKARHRRCFTRAVRICRHRTRCVTSDRVEAVAAHGKVVTIQKLKRGRFRLALPPGHYSIRLLTDGNHPHRHVLQRRSVNARAHHTTHVRFSFRAPSGDGTAS
jgi:hypothetical protein